MTGFLHAKQSFSEFEGFSEAARSWDFDFRQLDRGPLNARQEILGTANTQIMHAQLGRKFHQLGASPNQGRTVALIDRGSSHPEWCGRTIAPDTMPVFAADGSFDSVSLPGFKAFTVTVTDDCMNRIADARELQRGQERFCAEGLVVACDRSVLDRLRHRMTLAFRLAEESQPSAVADLIRFILEQEVPSLVLSAAGAGLERNRHAVRPRLRARTLRLALEYIEAHAGSYIALEDLCDVTGASTRTLRYAFQDKFDMPPVRYLLAYRLNAARRELAGARSRPTSIQRVAEANGFRHMGLFSVNYRKMFGESPSETLKKRDG